MFSCPPLPAAAGLLAPLLPPPVDLSPTPAPAFEDPCGGSGARTSPSPVTGDDIDAGGGRSGRVGSEEVGQTRMLPSTVQVRSTSPSLSISASLPARCSLASPPPPPPSPSLLPLLSLPVPLLLLLPAPKANSHNAGRAPSRHSTTSSNGRAGASPTPGSTCQPGRDEVCSATPPAAAVAAALGPTPASPWDAWGRGRYVLTMPLASATAINACKPERGEEHKESHELSQDVGN